MGWSVAGAGDINNDTYDDILLGVPRNNDMGEDSGKAYFISRGSPPIFSYTPEDRSIPYDSNGNTLTWRVKDESIINPKYSIFQNEIPFDDYIDKEWQLEKNITINIDGLIISTHSFTIVVKDGFGWQVQDEVIVRVLENNEVIGFPLMTIIPISIYIIILALIVYYKYDWRLYVKN